MRSVVLFVEDAMHEKFVGALVRHMLGDVAVVLVRSARGGHGKVVEELRKFVAEVRRERASPPDLLVVATDCNCKGHARRRKELEAVTSGEGSSPAVRVAFALPDPHVERWLLQDSAAFKRVFGKGCDAPDQKCERDRYKRLLRAAIEDAGTDPLQGGVEFAEEMVGVIDFDRIQDHRLKSFVEELAQARRAWEPGG